MNRPFNKVILAVIAVVIVIVGFIILKPSKNTKHDGFGLVERGDIIQRISLSGVVQPVRKALIIAPYNGYVKKVYVKTGDRVKQGDPIVSIVQSLSNFEESFPLRSPITGQIVQVRYSEGEYVTSTSATDFIVRIDDQSEMYVTVNAAEIDRLKMNLKQEAILRPMALDRKTYKAQIVDIALAANDKDRYDRSSVVEFPVKMKILDADSELKSGMSTLIDIVIFKKENLLTLRHEFVYSQGEENYVLLPNGEKRAIKVGSSNEEKVEVLEGLREGEKVQKVDFASILGNS